MSHPVISVTWARNNKKKSLKRENAPAKKNNRSFFIYFFLFTRPVYYNQGLARLYGLNIDIDNHPLMVT